MGKYGLGDRSYRIVQFCQENNMIVANTLYKLPDIRLYTSKAPGDKEDKTIRNQIDYIMINERYRNAIKSVKAYRGADVSSDHNPLAAKVKLTLKRITKPISKRRINARKLQIKDIQENIQQEIHKNLDGRNMETETRDINELWEFLKQCTSIQTKNEDKRRNLRHDKATRTHKHQDKNKYTEIDKLIRIKIRSS